MLLHEDGDEFWIILAMFPVEISTLSVDNTFPKVAAQVKHIRLLE